MDRYLVISSDGHAGPRASEYRDYVDPEYREMFDVALPIQIQMTEEAAKRFLVADINREWREGREHELSGAWDAEARDKVLDADGIAAEVLFPDGLTEMNAPPFGAGFSMSPEGVTADLQWAGCVAHNRWMAEFVSTAPERRIGLGCIPVLWDVERAVEGIRWCHENGLRGVIFPPRWGSFDGYHHVKYDPVWEICQDLALPVHFHSGPSPFEEYFGPIPAPAGHEVQPGAMGAYITEVSMWLVRPLTFMLWGGVFERFPALKAVVTEGTAVWVPEYLELLEQRYSVSHYAQKLGDYRSHLSMSPADYFRRNVRVGASCMPRREALMRHQIGIDNIMWGTDYPHPEGSWPYTAHQMHETFDGLPEDEIAKMLGGNAAEVYGVDTEKLVPLVARIGPEKKTFRAGD